MSTTIFRQTPVRNMQIWVDHSSSHAAQNIRQNLYLLNGSWQKAEREQMISWPRIFSITLPVVTFYAASVKRSIRMSLLRFA